jgi:hypothetical protein
MYALLSTRETLLKITLFLIYSIKDFDRLNGFEILAENKFHANCYETEREQDSIFMLFH